MKQFISFIFLLLICFGVSAQVGINTATPHPSAVLDLTSGTNNKGFLPPRLTSAQRDAIASPAIGLIIYNTTTNCLNFYANAGWNETCGNLAVFTGTSVCANAVNTGTLTSGVGASGVSSSVPYTGGNGGNYGGQTVISTGVTGLTAFLGAGVFDTGAGNLVYTITGTPGSNGTASFALNIGGQMCTLTRTVTALPLPNICNPSNPTTILDVTNSVTGKIWMDRNLGANRAATSSTDAESYGSLFQWGRGSDGHQCVNRFAGDGVTTSGTTTTLSSSDTPGNGNFITVSTGVIDWRSPQNNNLWQGLSGINNPCPSGYRVPTEAELDAERTSWSSQNAAGAFASPLKLSLGGNRTNGGGLDSPNNFSRFWSSTVNGTNARAINITTTTASIGDFTRARGLSVRCLKDDSPAGAIGSINCGGAANTGTLNSGVAASGVSSSVPYTGGNGGSHAGQTVTSTGVTGLTAYLFPGVFATGAGSLVYTITGTPGSSGTASFALNIGGQTCTLTRTVICNSSTTIVEVTNSVTGKIWMDRNLGANRAATSSTDTESYGSLYQWGRATDGHQCVNRYVGDGVTTSNNIGAQSATDSPGHGDFIIQFPDWRSTQNNNLWQGLSGINKPCPSGYRIPTEAELNAERTSWNSNNAAGAFASPLKLTVAGRRADTNGSLGNVGTQGDYWSSTVAGATSRGLSFNSSIALMQSYSRALGFSVRCLKDDSPAGAIGSIDCGGATNSGTLTSGVAASGVSSSVPYTGGNGGSHAGQTVTSTGVTGLTAYLYPGVFASGAGSLVYTITGTPATSGTASFALNIGGQTCTLTRTVNLPIGVITTLTCASAVNTGTLTSGVVASGVSSSVPYTGGNGGSHTGQTVTSTGVTGLTATLTAGTFATGAGSLVYNITGTPGSSGTASFALNIGGQMCTLTRTVAAGAITTLDCANAVNTGTLTSGVVASGVSSSVPYTGGNGGTHGGQTVTSTGVTGLTATLTAGTFVSGAGSLVYNITGTPGSSGTASFALNIGGQMCTLTRTVAAAAGVITTLDCANAVNTGTLTSGVAASAVSSSVPYTGGNGGTHGGQTVTSTGVTGLTATLAAGSFVSGAGSLVYNITGTPGGSGTASFALNIGGQMCTLTRTVAAAAGAITTLDCANAVNTGTLTAGVAASGVSSSVPYTGGNGGTHSGQTVTSTGVTGLTATLAAGSFASGAGSLLYTITGTPATSGTASFALNIGGQTCTLTRTVNLPVGLITTLDCANAVNTGTLTSGLVASGVSSSVPYTGGNGGTHSGQTVTSTGVTGLTATLAAGSFATGAGSLVYNITGTPATNGTASFALNIGGQMCTLTRTVAAPAFACGTSTVTFTYNGNSVTYGTVGSTGNKCWLDRNLGATQVSTSSTDAASYGDLFQWGRWADGHQVRNPLSGTTPTLSTMDSPGHSDFILAPSTPYDWRSPQNGSLWQGVSGTNNPCPSGYRLPTEAELDAERLSWAPNNNAAGAFASPLKLPLAGNRSSGDGSLGLVGTGGNYWSSTVIGSEAKYLSFNSSIALMTGLFRAYGFTVRCIKD